MGEESNGRKEGEGVTAIFSVEAELCEAKVEIEIAYASTSFIHHSGLTKSLN